MQLKASAIPQIQSRGISTLATDGRPVGPIENSAGSPVTRSPAAERMRLHRERKKNGMRCLTIELRETEIEALIRKGFLTADTRNDTSEIIDAIYAYFDRELK
jgi:hypothetical protein